MLQKIFFPQHPEAERSLTVDAVALLGGNEYLVQQLLDRLLDAGFTTAQVKMDKTQNRLKALNMFLFIQSSTPTSTANFVNFQECL